MPCFHLSFLQEEVNPVGMKLSTRRAQTGRSLAERHGRQAPILADDNIICLRHIEDLDVGFLGIVSHQDVMIRLDVVIETGHRPHRKIMSAADIPADSQDRFGAGIRIYQDLHGIFERTYHLKLNIPLLG